MNRLEHLLCILAEECAEVAQNASKAQRFGLDDCEPGQQLTNEERIWNELNDLHAVAEMLLKEREFANNGQSRGLDKGKIEAKKQRVEKYLLYSEARGTLTS